MAKKNSHKKARRQEQKSASTVVIPSPPWEVPLDTVISLPVHIHDETLKKSGRKQNKETNKTFRLSFRKMGFILFIAWLIFFIDQISKIGAQVILQPRGSQDFGLFSLTYTTNTGAAFSLFSEATIVLLLLSFVVVQVILFFILAGYFFPRSSIGAMVVRYLQIPIHQVITMLILGGAAGNLFDRVFRGYVIDFIDVRWFAAFNVADSAISIAVFFVLLETVIEGIKKRKKT